MSRYVPPLDGLRAVSIGIVVISHCGFQPIVPGLFGVTIFFFVSGYLITGQVLAEIDRRGTLDVRGFYLRRMLRLYPALLVMVLFGSVVFVAAGGALTAADVAAALGYGANIWEQWGGFNAGAGGEIHPLGILWSLAVEEHYYVLFPLLAWLIGDRRRVFLLVVGLLIVAVGLWRAELTALCGNGALSCHFLRVERGTDTRVDSILFGAALAALLHGHTRAATIGFLQRRWVFPTGVALLLGALVIRDPWFRDVLRYDVQGLGLFACIGGLLFDPRLHRLSRALSWPPALLLGRWSYSLYLWHWVVIAVASITAPAAWDAALMGTRLPPFWLLPTLAPLSLALAAASYYGVEQPMLAVRRRFGSAVTADAAMGVAARPTDQARALTPGSQPFSSTSVGLRDI